MSYLQLTTLNSSFQAKVWRLEDSDSLKWPEYDPSPPPYSTPAEAINDGWLLLSILPIEDSFIWIFSK